MTASPQMAAAFDAWKLAALASHYAAPCPDEVMADLVDRESTLFDVLMDHPAANADDMLLKLFPLLLHEWEPKRGDPPMVPAKSRAYGYSEHLYLLIINDLGVRSPLIAEAMRAPVNTVYAAEAA